MSKTKMGFMKRHDSKLIFLAVCLGIAGLLALTIGFPGKQHPKHKANTINLSHCTNDDTCKQETHYKQIVEKSGVKDAFKQLRADYESDESVRSNCHPLTHVIGRVAGQKFASVSEAYAEGDEFCWSGYYHGVMEAILSKIKPEAVAGELNNICADLRHSKAYTFAHYNCVHGLGHGVMLITGHELFESLKTCDNLHDDWEKQSCYGGAYMENVMASNNPNHTTKYIIADQPLYPCTAVENKYKEQCYLMQTSQALVSLDGSFLKVFALCGTVEADYRPTCYQSLGRDASGRSVSDAEQTKATCMLGQNEEAQVNCIIGAAKDFISYHHSDVQAKALCAMLPENLSNTCTLTTQSYYQTF